MSVCMNKLKVLLVALLLAASLVVTINGTVYADTPGDENLPEAYVVVNGEEITIEEGDLLGKSERVSTIGFELNEQYNRGYVQGEYTQEGNIKVTDIEFWHSDVCESSISKDDDKWPTIVEESELSGRTKLKEQETSGMFNTLTGTNTQAWAKSTILCPFGVTATEVYSEVNYIDYGTSITPISTIHDWYDSALAYLVWWQIASNSGSTASIWSWTLGRFDSDAPGNQLHTHTAKVTGYPGHRASMYFTLDRLPDWIIPGVKFQWHKSGGLNY